MEPQDALPAAMIELLAANRSLLEKVTENFSVQTELVRTVAESNALTQKRLATLTEAIEGLAERLPPANATAPGSMS